MDLLINCTYYYGFSYWIARTLAETRSNSNTELVFWTLMWLLCEAGNYSCHKGLARCKYEGPQGQYKVPRSWDDLPLTKLFDYVSCPHYFCEVGSWLCYAMLTDNTAAKVFGTVGFFVLASWARSKHQSYKEKFIGYPPERRAMIPFIF